MVADAKRELRALIDQLDDDTAARALTYARRLLHARQQPAPAQPANQQQPHALPTLHRAAAITDIDELRANIFGPNEGSEAFDRTIRLWREQPESV